MPLITQEYNGGYPFCQIQGGDTTVDESDTLRKTAIIMYDNIFFSNFFLIVFRFSSVSTIHEVVTMV